MAAQVLVVEDDPDIRETVLSVLRDEGYDADEAPDGAEALRVLAASLRPCVVLLDLVMPRLSGVELLQAVAADLQDVRRGAGGDLARHAYVVMSANAEALPPPLVRLLAPLGVAIVRKPFDLDDLLAAVDAAAHRLVTVAGSGLESPSLLA